MDLCEIIFRTFSLAYHLNYNTTPVIQYSIPSHQAFHTLWLLFSTRGVEKHGSATPLILPNLVLSCSNRPSLYLNNYFIATFMKVVTVAF